MKTTLRICGTITIGHADMSDNDKDNLITDWDVNMGAAMDMIAEALHCYLISNNLDVDEYEWK